MVFMFVWFCIRNFRLRAEDLGNFATCVKSDSGIDKQHDIDVAAE